ncbi:MAG: ABC transporter substrate-binding protein [Lachnospiraceae bacterium]|nr:ABC transporter substrate-binding protein [Lachnospiraceae bacterium]
MYNLKKIRNMVLLVIASLLLLSGCGKEKESSGAEENSDRSIQEVSLEKGRYAEEVITLPYALNTLFDVRKTEEGTLQLAFESEPGSLYFYESRDMGKSWESRLEIAAGELPKGYRAIDACIKSDGDIIISVGEMSEEAIREKRPVGQYEYYVLQTEDGNAEPLSLNIPEGNESSLAEGYGLSNLKISEDNFLYGTLGVREGEGSSNTLYCLDLENGQQKWSKKIAMGEFSLYGNTIYLNEIGQDEDVSGKLIKTLNAETGEETEAVLLPAEVTSFESVDLDSENQKIYFGTKEGIFASDDKLTLKEKLVDGKLCSMSAAGYGIKNLYMLDEKIFLVFMQGNRGDSVKFLRYEYDAELDSRPSTLLTVYSLKENSIIEKMVFDFQEKNPDILINYRVGMEEQNGASVTDAINILNTEIMAGKGPDVIILNGLPWQSYSEKGILMNLEGELSSLMGETEFFTNLFEPYQENEGQFAVPVSFKIPVVLNNKNIVQQVNSLEELMEATGHTGEVAPHFRKDERLLRYLVSICWDSVQNGDNIDREALKSLLEQIKEMNDILMSFENVKYLMYDSESDNTRDHFGSDVTLDVYSVLDGYSALDMGYLSDIRACLSIYNSSKVEMGTVNGKVFSPLLVGISAKTESEDLAKQFFRFMLSEEQNIFSVNEYPIMYNFPVNRDAFRTITQAPSEEEQAEVFQAYSAFGEYRWPDEEYFGQIEEKIMELSVPAMEDTVVIDTVLESVMPCLRGEKDIETAVNEITQKLELYFAE